MSRTTARLRALERKTQEQARATPSKAISVTQEARQHLARLYGAAQEAQVRFQEAAMLVAVTLGVDTARYRFDFQRGFVLIEEQQTADIPLAPSAEGQSAEQDEGEEGDPAPG